MLTGNYTLKKGASSFLCTGGRSFGTRRFAIMQATHGFRRLRFGVFEADFRTGELTKNGRRVRLQDQPFQLLVMLLDKPGELITREELHNKLWPNTIVDFDHGLNKAISKIREALGDSAENPRFIETVASRGYRFLADVAAIRDEQPETVAGDLVVQADHGPLRVIDAGTTTRRLPRALAWRPFGHRHCPGADNLPVVDLLPVEAIFTRDSFPGGAASGEPLR